MNSLHINLIIFIISFYYINMYSNNCQIYLYKNSNDYFLYFTISISIISIIFTLSVIFDSNILVKLFFGIHSFNQHLLFKIKKQLFPSTTSISFLNFLFNSPNFLQTRFFNEFLHSLNETFFHRQVTNQFFAICHIQ